jgi:hypothetical protein
MSRDPVRAGGLATFVCCDVNHVRVEEIPVVVLNDGLPYLPKVLHLGSYYIPGPYQYIILKICIATNGLESLIKIRQTILVYSLAQLFR